MTVTAPKTLGKPLPGPTSPSFVQTLYWLVDPLGLMDNHTKNYGDLFAVNSIGPGYDKLIFACHPRQIKELFARDGKELSTPGRFNGLIQPLVGSQSLLLLSGNDHRRRRKLILPPFHGDRLKSYGNTIQTIAQEIFNQWTPGQKFVARHATQELTLRVIMETVFGITGGDRFDAMKPLLTEMVDMVAEPIRASLLFFPVLQKSWGPWGKFERARADLDVLIYGEISDRRKAGVENREDILSLLMTARDEDGNPMTDEELRDELITLLFAGHETTATAMAWAIYWLHRQPECLEKLRDELSAVPDDMPPMDMMRLPYLSAVCNEALRLYPVAIVTFPRYVEKSFELDGYTLEQGRIILGSIYSVHHQEDIFPDSHAFRPERFLERSFSATEFMPFGGGSRRCVGAALAMAELAIALGTWLKQGNFALNEPGPVQPQRRGVTLGQKGGVNMRFVGPV
ncbi:MAG: cytochrome P450 [Cyanobacteria bacterium P01_C01_bin.89]